MQGPQSRAGQTRGPRPADAVRVISLICAVCAVAMLSLAQRGYQFAIPVGIVVGWAAVALAFSQRQEFFPQIKSFSRGAQDAIRLFGWIALALLAVLPVAGWLIDAGF